MSALSCRRASLSIARCSPVSVAAAQTSCASPPLPHDTLLLACSPQVFEYMETDLEAVIKDKRLHLGIGDIKSYLQMTLRAVRRRKHLCPRARSEPPALRLPFRCAATASGLASHAAAAERYAPCGWRRAPCLSSQKSSLLLFVCALARHTGILSTRWSTATPTGWCTGT